MNLDSGLTGSAEADWTDANILDWLVSPLDTRTRMGNGLRTMRRRRSRCGSGCEDEIGSSKENTIYGGGSVVKYT